jgi:trehalose-6-phosphate synthase
MNLVAKEFVSLSVHVTTIKECSSSAGSRAAQELTGALIVNPYAIDETAQRLVEALHMTKAEQSNRMAAMRRVVAEFNAYRWAREMVVDATHLRGHATRLPVELETHAERDPKAASTDDWIEGHSVLPGS